MYARGREGLLFRHWRNTVPLLITKLFVLPAVTIPRTWWMLVRE